MDDIIRKPIRWYPNTPFPKEVVVSANANLYKFDITKRVDKELTKRIKCIQRTIIKQFGSSTAVVPVAGCEKSRYKIECPVTSCNKASYLNIHRHLVSNKHCWSETKAKLFSSTRVRLFNHYTRINKRHPSPAICRQCNVCFDRLDTHLINVHHVSRGTRRFKLEMERGKKAVVKQLF